MSYQTTDGDEALNQGHGMLFGIMLMMIVIGGIMSPVFADDLVKKKTHCKYKLDGICYEKLYYWERNHYSKLCVELGYSWVLWSISGYSGCKDPSTDEKISYDLIKAKYQYDKKMEIKSKQQKVKSVE